MQEKSKSWAQHFEFVYSLYCKKVVQLGVKPSLTGFQNFLETTRGKIQNWKAGQWPSAEDLETMHEKLGLSYRWLVSGEGEPFDSIDKLLAEKDAEIEKLKNQLLFADHSKELQPDTAKAAG